VFWWAGGWGGGGGVEIGNKHYTPQEEQTHGCMLCSGSAKLIDIHTACDVPSSGAAEVSFNA